MQAQKKVSVPLRSEELALHLANDPSRPRLLVGGLSDQKALKKFLNSIAFSAEQGRVNAGSTFGYVNVEVVTPENQSFFAVKVTGQTEFMLQALKQAAHLAGLATASVSAEFVTPDGAHSPIPLGECRGILHNVYANSAPQ